MARTREPRRIQSIEVGFRLIRVLEQARTRLSLKDVAGRAGMPSSKALLYLSSFMAEGLVARDSAGQYSLGPYAVQLGLAGLQQVDVIHLAGDDMLALQASTRQAVYLSIWGNHGPTIVSKLDSELPLPVSVRVGYVLPVLTSATGRVFLAWLPLSVTQNALTGDPGSKTTSPEAIAELMEAVRRDGVAGTGNQVHLGIAALSAPIFDHQRRLCAALTVLGPSPGIDTDPRGALAQQLCAATVAISRRLGLADGRPEHRKG